MPEVVARTRRQQQEEPGRGAALLRPTAQTRDPKLVTATRWSFLTLVASYCFVWPRIPLGFVELPVQRVLVALAALVLTVALIAHRRTFAPQGPGRFLGRVGVLITVLAISLVAVVLVGGAVHLADRGFDVLAWLMDVVKYVACSATMVMTYLVLRLRLVSLRAIASTTVASSIGCILVAYGCLVAYLSGFRSFDSTLLRSFGGAIGVWPTDGVLPRLVGTSTEPQQLSVLFVTGLLLMVVSRRRMLWLAAIAGIGVLLLSQSKFALASALVVIVVAILVIGRRARLRRKGWIVLGAGFTLVGAGGLVALAQLPIFAQTLREGANATAVQERLQNAGVLSGLVERYFWQGIGAGQYGIYRGRILGLLPDPSYYPNNDYMKVFAELGVVGFAVLVAVLLVVLGGYAVRVARGRFDAVSATFAVGALLILTNMLIGYEMLHIFLWLNLGVVAWKADQRPRLQYS